MNTTPVVLFFLTDFNSVDHMAPIAYKMVATKQATPVLLVTNPFYDIDGDYRLEFLKREYGLTAKVVFAFHQKNPVIRWIMARLCHPLGGTGLRHKLYPQAVKWLRRAFYRRAWARGFLRKYDSCALLFERVSPTVGIESALIHEGRRSGITSICLPHGMDAYTNKFTDEIEVLEGKFPQRPERNLFDYVVYQNAQQARRAAEEGLSPDKAVALGSARFCPEWASVNQSIQPATGFRPVGDTSGRQRVVFMLTQWNINVHRSETIDTLVRLSKMDSIYLVVKPHPRHGPADLIGFLKETLPQNVEISWDVPSPSLIRWSDVVLNIGSSIALEVLLQGKPLLQLNYLHSNTTVFQDVNSCWNIGNDDELVSALDHLRHGGFVPYGDDEISEAMSILVLGGAREKDVLQQYVDFILAVGGCISGRRTRSYARELGG